MQAQWQRAITSIGADIVNTLTLKRVMVSKDGTRVVAEFIGQTLLDRAQREMMRRDLQAAINGSDLTINISYPNLIATIAADIDAYKPALIELLGDDFPAERSMLLTADWEMTTGGFALRTREKVQCDLLTARGIDARFTAMFREIFRVELPCRIEDAHDHAESVALLKEQREKIDALMVEQAKSASENAPKIVEDTAVILGKKIEGTQIELKDLAEDSGSVIARGEVMNLEYKDIKTERGASTLLTFLLTDFTNTLPCKAFLKGKSVASVKEALKNGQWYVVKGRYQYDTYAREHLLMTTDITRRSAPKRTDTATDQRVELHLHTKMSAMDGMTDAEALIRRAANWGHSAIAITDHGVLQAFPEAFDAAKKVGIKLIPGCEAYLIDDAARIVENPDDRRLSGAEFVVLDVETTGLNSTKDAITEIGAVRIKGGAVVAEFSRLINPGVHIPAKITELTGITDAMVANQPHIAEIADEFVEFCAGAVLAAHNADFDMGFINRALHVDAPILDTLALSRNALPGLKNHKLPTVAKHFSINQGKHHRALDDAKTTAAVFSKMLESLDIERLNQLNDAFSGDKGGHSRHVTLLARTQKGLENLNHIVSDAHLLHYYRRPLVPRSTLNELREGILVGSACEAGEVYQTALNGASHEKLMDIARFYDYLEIQPNGNNMFLVRSGRVKDEDALNEINLRILAVGDALQIPVVATGDVHFLDPKDAIYREILMTGMEFDDADQQAPLHFKTTDEMLDDFAFLGARAREVVIDNPQKLAARVENISLFIPHPQNQLTFQPVLDGAEEAINRAVYARAHEIYGDPLPDIVNARVKKELSAIIGYGFATLYEVARRLVQRTNADGYLVGSRGSIGSSLVAFFAGITEVNALPPHYVCSKCQHTSFETPDGCGNGVDLPDAACEKCDAPYNKDGFNTPFEMFLGFAGDKVPDIDLNFSGAYQPRAHAYIEELFGKSRAFRAGTISKLADKTAYGYVMKYFEKKGQSVSRAEVDRLTAGCVGVKKTTGQHPGGIVILPEEYNIYQFTAIQRPADDAGSDTITTHYDFGSMHDVLVKIDILGHDDPTMLHTLKAMTGVDPLSIKLNDAKVISLFSSPDVLGVNCEQIGSATGTLGIPEFGTSFVRGMLVDTRPNTMEELIRISGLSHGTGVWLNNAQDIIKSGTAPLKECVCTREDILNPLLKWGIAPKTAFDITESVRKGRGLKSDMEDVLNAGNIPKWYITSLKTIEYLFPRAHAVAYVIMALRIAWFKVYYPQAYYACFLKRNADAFDARVMCSDIDQLRTYRATLLEQGKDASATDKRAATLCETLIEMNARGIRMLPVDVYASDAEEFLPENAAAIRPPLSAVPGLGAAAAQTIVLARTGDAFLSVEDMITRKIPKAACALLKSAGFLADLPDTSQMSFFDL